MTGLRPVINDEQLAILRILVDRRRSLGEDHTRMISQLHQLLWRDRCSPEMSVCLQYKLVALHGHGSPFVC
jgi:hypothetical protein